MRIKKRTKGDVVQKRILIFAADQPARRGRWVYLEERDVYGRFLPYSNFANLNHPGRSGNGNVHV